ncbi:MAG: HAMP domain-containing histidine kinase [Tatlockia sp.]|nr:HAMP domain-containing histidine kinase [Tatlockia sp.]
MTVLVLSVLLLDLLSLFIILTLGIGFGIIAFLGTGGILDLPQNATVIFITYGSILFFGSVFSYRKDQLKEREKRIAAEAANQAKADFISNMEHDLRTPFSGIHGIASFLYELETDPSKTEYLKLMIESCSQWENIHNRILAALLNKKPHYIQKETVFIANELAEIKAMMAATLHLKKLKFIIEEIPKDLEKIETDKMKFDLILTNLISNAINFTVKGTIKITVSREGNRWNIQIIDTGIGIPADKLDYIFEQFTKLSRSNKYGSNFKGVGLGLYTARQHAQLIGASISVESKLGEGSVFTLSLPISI